MIRRIASGLRDAWTVFGISLILLAVLEVGAGRWLACAASSDGVRFDETTADAFEGADWARDYVAELAASRDYEWRSYVYWKRRPFAGEYIHVDETGLRQTWRAPTLIDARDPLRVFVIGGSTAWGRGARDDFTIPSHVAKILSEEGAEPVAVTNLAESAWVNTQSMLALMLELQRGNVPDFVVFYEGANDVFAAYQNGVAGLPQNEARTRLVNEKLEHAFFLRVAERLALFRFVQRYFSSKSWSAVAEGATPYPQATSEQRSKLAHDVVALFSANMRAVDALGEKSGFTALAYWQPVIFSKRNRTPHEEKILAYTRERFPLLDQLFADVVEIVDDDPYLASTSRFRSLVDVLGASEDGQYIDFVHLSERANRAIAVKIAADVGKLMETKLRKPAGG